jgi:hypothetical protein
MKKHEPWFNEGCSKLLDEWKQAKLQWLQDPSEINGDNLNNVRCEASRYFRNKEREYLKDKIIEPATNSKNKNIRDLYRRINDIKRGYQPRNNLVKDENDDLLADSQHILKRWKNYFSQLLSVHNVSGVRQIEVHTAESGSNQIPAELFQAKGEILSEIHKLITSVWNRVECLISGRSLLLYRFTKRVIKLTVIVILGYRCYQTCNKVYRISCSQG